MQSQVSTEISIFIPQPRIDSRDDSRIDSRDESRRDSKREIYSREKNYLELKNMICKDTFHIGC